MKTFLSFLTLLIVSFIFSSSVLAQCEFGIQPYCLPKSQFTAKKIPVQTLKDLFTTNHPTDDSKMFCLGAETTIDAEGFEADFDGDSQLEILLLIHGGDINTGCNTLYMIREGINKSYTFVDIYNIAPGKAVMCPVKLMQKGVQVYVQSAYALADGAVETKGAFFAFEKESLVVLISWIQKDGTVDGNRVVTKAQCGLSDVDFQGIKELFLLYSTYQPGAGKPDEKNMVDQYALQLQFAPNFYRYVMYDSSGYDKIQQAEQLKKAGERLLYRETTAEEGVMKLKEAITLNPFQSEARIVLGRYFLRIGKPSDAERTFLQAIEMDPLYPSSYLYLGDTYIKLNTLQEALDNYKKYLELNPNARDRKSVENKMRQITVWKKK